MAEPAKRPSYRPPYVETLAEKRIREAMERGEFDNLKGSGKPLPSIDQPYREDWWINGLIEREQLDMSGAMSPTMALRREAADLPGEVVGLPSEQAVRRVVEDFNRRVKLDRLRPATGREMPPIAKTLDVEEMVALWREAAERRRAEREAQAAAEAEARAAALAARPRRWWQRRR